MNIRVKGTFSRLLGGVAMLLSGLILSTSVSADQVTGAIFTTTSDGSAVDANLYNVKTDVYLNGGPAKNSTALRPGTYYFQVTDPSGTPLLSTDDPARCRQVVVNASGLFSALAPVGSGCPARLTFTNAANGALLVQLAPYEDTTNAGGEYKAWLISQEEGVVPNTIGCGSATVYPVTADSPTLIFPNSCAKTDNFKIRAQIPCDPTVDPTCNRPPSFVLEGLKFYDANDSGTLDPTEIGIGGFEIAITVNSVSVGTVTTDSTGAWAYPGPLVTGDTYTACEVLPGTNPDGTYWIQTAPAADSQNLRCYSGVIASADVTGLDFGNLCLHAASGGLTLGFWSNKNGQKILAGDAGAWAFLDGLNLKNANGTDFDPTVYAGFRTWLLNATATNMAYMLSAQLATTELDVREGFLNAGTLILTPDLGVQSISQIEYWANFTLGQPGGNLTTKNTLLRAYEQDLEATLDGINNNNLPFVQPPGTCAITY